ncbi:hypothetical protein DFH09DRAFT_1078640 [Mycena vulgaris]|nr:hypothetical protein DFH09DRAFT_1078640 [Mycena vulgaris]
MGASWKRTSARGPGKKRAGDGNCERKEGRKKERANEPHFWGGSCSRDKYTAPDVQGYLGRACSLKKIQLRNPAFSQARLALSCGTRKSVAPENQLRNPSFPQARLTLSYGTRKSLVCIYLGDQILELMHVFTRFVIHGRVWLDAHPNPAAAFPLGAQGGRDRIAVAGLSSAASGPGSAVRRGAGARISRAPGAGSGGAAGRERTVDVGVANVGGLRSGAGGGVFVDDIITVVLYLRVLQPRVLHVSGARDTVLRACQPSQNRGAGEGFGDGGVRLHVLHLHVPTAGVLCMHTNPRALEPRRQRTQCGAGAGGERVARGLEHPLIFNGGGRGGEIYSSHETRGARGGVVARVEDARGAGTYGGASKSTGEGGRISRTKPATVASWKVVAVEPLESAAERSRREENSAGTKIGGPKHSLSMAMLLAQRVEDKYSWNKMREWGRSIERTLDSQAWPETKSAAVRKDWRTLIGAHCLLGFERGG